MSLSGIPSLLLLGYSNSLRVTHPDVVVIGLLCVDGVPQGSGSLCLHVLLYKQVGAEEEVQKNKNKKTMPGLNEFKENHSHR